MSSNPLAGYFRRPAIYIQLPSNGVGYPEGTIEIPENGEFPVFPMTAADEIAYRTPDGLLNGSAVVEVIQSCMPNIKNAWAVPSVDLDKILISIRLASYGHQMDIDTTCPQCKNEDRYAVDLRGILDSIKPSSFDQTFPVGNLIFKLKPLNLKQINENNLTQFEEQRIYAHLVSSDMDEEQKLKMLADAFKKLGQLTIKAVLEAVEYIQTEETVVAEREHIAEFLLNCEKDVFNAVKKHIIGIKSNSEIPPLTIKCGECDHTYEQPFTVDMSHFFE